VQKPPHIWHLDGQELRRLAYRRRKTTEETTSPAGVGRRIEGPPDKPAGPYRVKASPQSEPSRQNRTEAAWRFASWRLQRSRPTVVSADVRFRGSSSPVQRECRS